MSTRARSDRSFTGPIDPRFALGVTVDIRASGQRRRELRLRVARRQVSEVLVWAGALTLVFGIVNYLTLPDDAVSSWIVNLVFGPFCLVLALAVRRDVFRGEGVPWAWAVGSVVLVAMLVNTFRLDPTPANLANLVAVITAFGPLMHVWGPFIVSAAAMVAISAACFLARPAAERVDDLLVVLAALAISALLLHRRISALNALADSQAQVDHLAMFDPMTDTVNRNGLDRGIAALSATSSSLSGSAARERRPSSMSASTCCSPRMARFPCAGPDR